jgi:hypothetical protein
MIEVGNIVTVLMLFDLRPTKGLVMLVRDYCLRLVFGFVLVSQGPRPHGHHGLLGFVAASSRGVSSSSWPDSVLQLHSSAAWSWHAAEGPSSPCPTPAVSQFDSQGVALNRL